MMNIACPECMGVTWYWIGDPDKGVTLQCSLCGRVNFEGSLSDEGA